MACLTNSLAGIQGATDFQQSDFFLPLQLRLSNHDSLIINFQPEKHFALRVPFLKRILKNRDFEQDRSEGCGFTTINNQECSLLSLGNISYGINEQSKSSGAPDATPPILSSFIQEPYLFQQSAFTSFSPSVMMATPKCPD